MTRGHEPSANLPEVSQSRPTKLWRLNKERASHIAAHRGGVANSVTPGPSDGVAEDLVDGKPQDLFVVRARNAARRPSTPLEKSTKES